MADTTKTNAPPVNNFSLVEQSKATALAAKIIQYQFSKLKLKQEVFKDKYDSLTKSRSTQIPEEPVPCPPHVGHPPQRVEIGFGFLESDAFIEFGWRPAYHDLTDSPKGYPDQGTLNFLNALMRYYPQNAQIKLEDLKIIEAGSLSPENTITRQLAWSFSTGFSQTILRDQSNHLLFNIGGGIGRSYHFNNSSLAYGLLKGSALAGQGLSKGFEAGPEMEVGLVEKVGANWQVRFRGCVKYYSICEKSFLEDVDFTITRFVGTRNAISARAGLHGIGWSDAIPEFLFSWAHYF